MKGQGRRLKLLLTLVLVVLVAAVVFVRGDSLVAAQSGGGFDLSWSTIDGGGGSSSGGSFALRGSIGQPDAGAMSGGDYTLGNGFWGGGELTLPTGSIYLPIVIKN